MRRLNSPQTGAAMKCAAAIALAALLTAPAHARSYEEIMREANAAFEAEDFKTAADRLDEAQAARPYSLFLTRNRVLTRILTGRMTEAIAIAQEIADRGLVLETPPNDAFDKMRADPAFSPVAARMAANAEPKGEPRVVAAYAEVSLLPEAFSVAKNKTLIGSARTGDIRNAAAKLEPFAKLDGGVFDIEQRKNAVYVAVNNQLAYERRGDSPRFAAIVELDPRSGTEKARHSFGPEPSLIGDIEIAKNGRIFASDSLTPRIFSIDREKATQFGGAVTREFTDPRFVNLQGIALDETHERLYVADYLAGLFVIDIKSGKADLIANPADAHLGGIDGLYLYKGDLIGVQNGASPQRIIRIDLDKAGVTAMSLDVLQQALPEWNEPTHGAVASDDFIYIATSNWPAYDDTGNAREGATLAPLRLMSAPLK